MHQNHPETKHLSSTTGPVLMSGNEACAEGAIRAGVRFYAGYPITPSSEIAEAMARLLPEVCGKFIQMEDEIASMAAIIGASLAGLKVMDATSGPGFSLKAEGIGLAVMLEVPCVVVNMQRVGPSTGMATLPAQMDVMMSRWGTHGDHAIIVLSPSSVRECFDLTVKAVNLAERFRSPVIVLGDAVVARMREKVVLPETVETCDRVRPTVPPEQYKPYRAAPNGICPMADYGSGYFWYANSSVHDENGAEATSRPEVAAGLLRRLHTKIYDYMDELPQGEAHEMGDADMAVFAYGITARAARAAVRMARQEGIKVGLLRPITIWPFLNTLIEPYVPRLRGILVPELNYGQLVDKVREVVAGGCKVDSLPRYDGQVLTPEQILLALRQMKR
ncbi:MAG: 2-oxoacid:acceptor oxidoreductase subunit alpha [Chloroflexi bacterium]|nr:2-oxoacid:acceptor oxidoreductase subunit alpha [Chloroflexota bacterium]